MKFIFGLLFSISYALVSSAQKPVLSANDFKTYLPYSGKYSYGVNQGYYSSNWTSQHTATIAIGSKASGVKGVGVKSLRVPLYDDFLSSYGLDAELKDFQFYASLGASEITAFVGAPAAMHRFDSTFEGATESSKVFKNLYEPIWLDSACTQVNPQNYYAKYLADIIGIYGSYVKFWEIVNEPDFTYSASGWVADLSPGDKGSWFYHDPNAAEMVNIRAPIYYYIRELRVAWEVIKQLSPNSYVCTGGIGYKSFLDAILRNTDNPKNGAVSKNFPLKGGAYFDVLSFHSYPEFYMKKWSQLEGKLIYFRHSDAAVRIFLTIKSNMDSLLRTYGYSGKKYPKKQFICTETGISRIMSGEDWGSNEGQKNFIVKAQIAAQKANIRQLYWYQLGDNNASNQFDRMGLYYFFGNNTPFNQSPSDQGVALKTTSDLLYGKSYDPIKSAALKLNSKVDGAAFKSGDGSYTYVLWARTTIDLSEKAIARYVLPSFLRKANFLRKEWDFSQTSKSSELHSSSIRLEASPSFFEPR